MGRDQELKGLAFCLYPLLFFLYSPFIYLTILIASYRYSSDVEGSNLLKTYFGINILILRIEIFWNGLLQCDTIIDKNNTDNTSQ